VLDQLNELLTKSSYIWAYMGIYGGTISIWMAQSFGNILGFEH